MTVLSVLVAAAASWFFGAIWYMALSKPWLKAAGVAVDENGKPLSRSALPFVLSAITMVIVAGFMRHIFVMSGLTEGVGLGLVAGLGVGLFFIAPWTMINNAYAGRPFLLTLIDGGYSVFGCGLIGAVLILI